MSRIICISNRVSLPNPQTGTIKAGGLAVGVKAALEANGGGVWFGWDGTVCKANRQKRRITKIQHDDITFLTIPLTETEYEHYYKKMANENLWPLMHELGEHIEGSASSYGIYKCVNRMFARLLKPYLKPDDLLWVHDYHLIPLGRELRTLGVNNRIGYFHHIPMPSEDFLNSRAVPAFLNKQYERLFEDLSAYDLVGFQSFRDFENFESCLSSDVYKPKRYESTSVRLCGSKTHFGVFPISVETADLIRQAREKKDQDAALASEKDRYRVLIGAERLDYTKGLANRLEGFFEFLQRYPDYQKKIKYHQITPLSRGDIRQYKQTIEKIRRAAGKIHNEYADESWQPLAYREEGMPREQLMGSFRHSDIGLVTPLIDGQNLVAKEYLAVQDPCDPGLLILSKNAGAAEELENLGVLCVDPYDTGEIADKINEALRMPRLQRIERHQRILSHLYQFDIEHWAESFLDEMAKTRKEETIIHYGQNFGAIAKSGVWARSDSAPHRFFL
ncbi:MAG: trehalose-6-phosphate synthase [Alphaproteobacteria bacterium]